MAKITKKLTIVKDSNTKISEKQKEKEISKEEKQAQKDAKEKAREQAREKRREREKAREQAEQEQELEPLKLSKKDEEYQSKIEGSYLKIGSGKGIHRLEIPAEDEEYNLQLPLISSVKNQNNTLPLLHRLLTLHNTLKKQEQGEDIKNALKTITRELLNSLFVGSKDLGVRALSACCLVDVLKFYAPDAPYSNSELEIIFSLILDQLKRLGDDSRGFGSYYNYLLYSLSTVRSLLCIVSDDFDSLLLSYFRLVFKLAKGNPSRETQLQLFDLFDQALPEMTSFPQEFVLTILDNLLGNAQTEYPAAFAIAKKLCENHVDVLQAPICQHFVELIKNSKKMDLTIEEEEEFRKEKRKERERDMEHDITLAYKQIRSVYLIVPQVLLSVIPQLEAELNTENEIARGKATSTLGPMLASVSNMTSKYPTVWKAWLSRRFDKSPNIRSSWLTQIPPFYVHKTEIEEINKAFEDKLLDLDEKVRQHAIRTLANLDYQLIKQMVPLSLLKAVGFRVRDKKNNVRRQAIKTLGLIFSSAYEDLIDDDVVASQKFGWIPSLLLEAIYTDENDVVFLAEEEFKVQILGSGQTAEARVERLCYIVSLLSEKAYTALKAMLKKQNSLCKDLAGFVEVVNELKNDKSETGEQTKEQLNEALDLLIARMTDKLINPAQHAKALKEYTKVATKAINDHLLIVCNIKSGGREIVKARNEILKKAEAISADLKQTFYYIFIRLQGIAHISMIPKLANRVKAIKSAEQIKKLDKIQRKTYVCAQKILGDILTVFPRFFREIVREIDQLVELDGKEGIFWWRNLANFLVTHNYLMPADRPFTTRLTKVILEGTVKQSKYAALALVHYDQTDDQLDKTIAKIVDQLNFNNSQLLSHLKALGVFFRDSSFYLEDHVEKILDFILNGCLLKHSKLKEPKTLIINVEELPIQVSAKIFGINILVKRAMYYAAKGTNSGIIDSVFNLLWTIIENQGEVVKESGTPDIYKSHLRLKAANSILKLARYTHLAHFIPPHKFISLAQTIQDEFYHVREGFGKKIIKYLTLQFLPPKYATILYLAAYDVEPEFKILIKGTFKNYMNANRIGNKPVRTLESNIARLIHLLAHDKDFDESLDNPDFYSKYIEFYLNIMATPQNISYIYSIVARAKSLYDNVSPQKNENIKHLCDLTLRLIHAQKNQHHWVVESYPGEIQLPRELFSTSDTSFLNKTLDTTKPNDKKDDAFYSLLYKAKLDNDPSIVSLDRNLKPLSPKRKAAALEEIEELEEPLDNSAEISQFTDKHKGKRGRKPKMI